MAAGKMEAGRQAAYLGKTEGTGTFLAPGSIPSQLRSYCWDTRHLLLPGAKRRVYRHSS